MSDRATTATSYAGSAVSIGSALTLTDIGIIVGIITALLTFWLNWWFQARRDRRDQEAHEARMRRYEAPLASRCPGPDTEGL